MQFDDPIMFFDDVSYDHVVPALFSLEEDILGDGAGVILPGDILVEVDGVSLKGKSIAALQVNLPTSQNEPWDMVILAIVHAERDS